MIEGTMKRIKWDTYECPNLALSTHKQPSNFFGYSCGTNAIGLLTGKSAKTIQALNPRSSKGETTTTRLQLILKHFGYSTKIITKGNLRSSHWASLPINRYHCMLLNVCLGVDSSSNDPEHSAYILHNDTLWHNWDAEPAHYRFFLSKPIQDAMIVYHPKWR